MVKEKFYLLKYFAETCLSNKILVPNLYILSDEKIVFKEMFTNYYFI